MLTIPIGDRLRVDAILAVVRGPVKDLTPTSKLANRSLPTSTHRA
jgi:hypothetical protein